MSRNVMRGSWHPQKQCPEGGSPSGHMFYTACQNNIGHTGFDHGRAAEYGFHPGNAYTIQRNSGHGFRNAGQKSSYTSGVECITVFNTTAEANIINHDRVYSL